MEKARIDVLLTDRGLFESRERAQAAIMAGIVFVDREKADKAGAKFKTDCEIEIKGNLNPYASRGGLKLEKALSVFKTSVKDLVAMDVGASTGGFTDCMLQNGAKKVYAVDVGYGQLAWHLRTDERVVCMERTNIRYIENELVVELLDFVTIDVSFISIAKVLPKVYELMKSGAHLICLIKPQFEAGRDKVGKKGVVKDPKIHQEVIEKVLLAAAGIGFELLGLSFSPIKGPEGNVEFLAWLKKTNPSEEIDVKSFHDIIVETVEAAHKEL